MPFLVKRTHLVTFRLSDEEYDALQSTCVELGVKSLSEFARSVVIQRVEVHKAPKVSLEGDLARLSSSLQELNGALQDVSGRISKVLGSSSNDHT